MPERIKSQQTTTKNNRTDSILTSNRAQVRIFFKLWTPTSAYVLGYFAADGCMYHSRNGGFHNGGYYFEFTSVDLELLNTVKEVMRIRNKVEIARRPSHSLKTKYRLRIVNQGAYKRLLELGFTPAKSLTMTFPKVPRDLLGHFIRGYFDGDGCVYYGQSRGKKILQTKFTSGSKQFLEVLQQKLLKRGITGKGSLHPHGTTWELSYSATDTRQLYQFLYSSDTVPCLRRKRLKFEQGIHELGPVA